MEGSPGDSVLKNPPGKVGVTGDTGLIPGSGRSLGVGNGNPLQHSCLGNPIDRGAWWVTVYGVAKSWTRLSEHTYRRLRIDFLDLVFLDYSFFNLGTVDLWGPDNSLL